MAPALAPEAQEHRKLERKVLWEYADLLLLFHFLKRIYKRSFPICAGKIFFKLRDKDFGFCKTNDDMKAFCKK